MFIKIRRVKNEISAEIRKSYAAVQMVMIDTEHISGKKVHEK